MRAFFIFLCVAGALQSFCQIPPTGEIIAMTSQDGEGQSGSPHFRIAIFQLPLKRDWKYLTAGEAFDISPSGKLLAVIAPAKPGGTGPIHILNIQTAKVIKVLPVNGCYPQWSRDGKSLAYEVFKDGKPSIYIIDTSGSNKRKVLDNARNPAWSPDGKLIAFSRNYDIYTFSVPDHKTRRLTRSRIIQEKFPVWNPGGEMIAFVSQHPDSATSSLEVVNVNTGERRWLSSCSEDHVSWTPDGKVLCAGTFGATCGPRAGQVAAIDPNNRSVKILLCSHWSIFWPLWRSRTN